MTTALTQKPKAADIIQKVRDEIAWRNSMGKVGFVDLKEDAPLERRLRDTQEIFTHAEEVLRNPNSNSDHVYFAIRNMQDHIAMYHRRKEFGYVMAFTGWYEGVITKSPHFQ